MNKQQPSAEEGAAEPVMTMYRGGDPMFGKANIKVRWEAGAAKLPDGEHKLYAHPPAVMPAAPSDAEIDALDKTFALHVMAPRGKASVREFARAVLALSQTMQPQAEPESKGEGK